MSNRLFCGCCGCPGDSVHFRTVSPTWEEAFDEVPADSGIFVLKKTLPDSWFRIDLRSIFQFRNGFVPNEYGGYDAGFFDVVDNLDPESDLFDRNLTLTLDDPATGDEKFKLKMFVRKGAGTQSFPYAPTEWVWVDGPFGGSWVSQAGTPVDIVSEEYQVILEINDEHEYIWATTSARTTPRFALPPEPIILSQEDTPFRDPLFYPDENDIDAFAVQFNYFQGPELLFWDDAIEMTWDPAVAKVFQIPYPIEGVFDIQRLKFGLDEPIGPSRLTLETYPSLARNQQGTLLEGFAWEGIRQPESSRNSSCTERATCWVLPPYRHVPFDLTSTNLPGVSSLDPQLASFTGCAGARSYLTDIATDSNPPVPIATSNYEAAELALVQAAEPDLSDIPFRYSDPARITINYNVINNPVHGYGIALDVQVVAWWYRPYEIKEWWVKNEFGNYVRNNYHDDPIIAPILDSLNAGMSGRTFGMGRYIPLSDIMNNDSFTFSGADIAPQTATLVPWTGVGFWHVYDNPSGLHDIRDLEVALTKDDILDAIDL